MAKLISFNKNKNFRLDIERWRDKRRMGRYLQYYLKPIRDERNSLAKNIDFYGPLTVVLLISFVLILTYSGNPVRAIVMFLPVMVFEVFTAFSIRKFFIQNATVHKKLWNAGERCRENIKKIKSLPKLERLVVEILEKIEGFTDVHIILSSENKEKRSGGSTVIRALLHGAPVAVGCLLAAPDHSNILGEQVIRFRSELTSLNLKAGVLVTTGFYSSEARRAAVEGKKKSRVVLLDLFWLVELARETGHKVFPTLAQEQNKIHKRSTERLPELARKIFAKEKARGYLLASGIMLAMYFLVGQSFKIGYALFGLFNLILAIYCLISNRENDLWGSVRTK